MERQARRCETSRRPCAWQPRDALSRRLHPMSALAPCACPRRYGSWKRTPLRTYPLLLDLKADALSPLLLGWGRLRQTLKLSLHRGKLRFQLGDLRRCRGARCIGLRLAQAFPRPTLRSGLTKGSEHRKCALEQRHVLPRLLLHRLESGGAKGIGELLSVFFLLACQRLQAEFEIFGNKLLNRMAVETDKLAQKADGQKVRAGFSLLPPR